MQATSVLMSAVGKGVPERRCRTLIHVAMLLAAVGVLAGCGGSENGDAVNGRIAFGKWDYALDDFRIWTAEPDGTDEQPLVPYVSWMSDWAPDGRRLVFEDSTSLKTIASDGTGTRVVVDSLGWQAVPKWSPTGEWIAFEGAEQKPADPVNASPDFERSVWLIRPNGKDLHRVTKEYDVEPVFSPDGNQLAFGHVTKPGPPDQAMQSVVVTNLDGTHRREIVPPTVGLQHVDWSPDGTWITYNIEPVGAAIEQPAGGGSVYAVRPDGTNLHVLVPSTDQWWFVKPVWSPDGKWLLTSCSRPATTPTVDRLCVIDLADGDVHLIVDHSDDTVLANLPSWGPSPN